MRRKVFRTNRAREMREMDALNDRFYQPTFKSGEAKHLDSHLAAGIQEEIDLLRIYMLRVSMMAKGIENLDEAIYALGALGSASTQIAGLLRSQKAIGEDSSGATDTLSRALTEVMREMNLR